VPIQTPGYKAGFAAPVRNQNYVYPSLWRGCVAAHCASLGETGLVLRDQSGFGNHGTLTNMDPATDWVPSQGKIALDFDGVNDKVLTGLFVNVNNNRITVASWIRPSVLTRGDVVAKWVNGVTSGDQFNLLYGLTSGKPQFFISSGSSTPTSGTGPATMQIGRWHHVTGTYDGASIEVYLDGVFQASTASTITMQTQAQAIAIGGNADVDGQFTGQQDDIRIYDRVLAPSEIATLSLRRGIAYETNRIRRYFIATSVHSLVADSISSGAPSIGSPVLTQVHALVALGIVAGAPVIGQSTLAQVHVLSPSSITTGAPVVGQSTLSQAHSLSANGIATGSPVVGQSTLSQVHVLSCGVIETGAPIVGTASMSGSVALSADGITTGSPVVGQSTLSQVHSLVSVSVVTGSPIVGQTTLSQVHVLVANSIAAGPPVVGQSTLSIVVIIVGINIGQVVSYRQTVVAFQNTVESY